MGITNQIPSSRLLQAGVVDNTAARPASPYEGQVIFQKDTDQLLVWNGTAWVIPNAPAQNPMGLELITTATCSAGGTAVGGVVTIGSGVSSVTVNNAFNAIYDNYKIVVGGGTSSAQCAMKFELGGSTASYYGSYLYGNYANTTSYAASMNNLTSVIYAGGANVSSLNMNLELQNPFLSKITIIEALTVAWGNNYGHTVCDHEVASSYSSFRIFPDTGTLTGGTIRVYGFRNS